MSQSHPLNKQCLLMNPGNVQKMNPGQLCENREHYLCAMKFLRTYQSLNYFRQRNKLFSFEIFLLFSTAAISVPSPC